jgi:hypothetical protein
MIIASAARGHIRHGMMAIYLHPASPSLIPELKSPSSPRGEYIQLLGLLAKDSPP